MLLTTEDQKFILQIEQSIRMELRVLVVPLLFLLVAVVQVLSKARFLIASMILSFWTVLRRKL